MSSRPRVGAPAAQIDTGILLAARIEAGLSQRELAARAGTSGATVAAYERGTKEPRLSTLLRLLSAAGMRLELSYAPVLSRANDDLTREDRRSLALHRVIAARFARDPQAVSRKAVRNLKVMRRADDGSAAPWLEEWERLLRGPVSAVIEVLVSHDQRARDLRQVTPFAGVLSDEERRAIYRTTAAA
jgi:transcriptional regulator with XRE-family HTH domain